MDDSEVKGRLNMDHGFMKSIIKNQVDRDNYDKEVKEAKVTKSQSKNKRPKKPEKQTYVPPIKQNSKLNTSNSEKDTSNSENNTSNSENTTGVPLFKFEFKDQKGEIHEIMVNKDDNPRAVAHSFGAQIGLSPPLISTLSNFLASQAVKISSKQ